MIKQTTPLSHIFHVVGFSGIAQVNVGGITHLAFFVSPRGDQPVVPSFFMGHFDPSEGYSFNPYDYAGDNDECVPSFSRSTHHPSELYALPPDTLVLYFKEIDHQKTMVVGTLGGKRSRRWRKCTRRIARKYSYIKRIGWRITFEK